MQEEMRSQFLILEVRALTPNAAVELFRPRSVRNPVSDLW
jgi:hypothetical protein